MDAPMTAEGNAYMYLYGTDEHATWDLEHSSALDLPYFKPSVEIRAVGQPHVLKQSFKVGSLDKSGSLRLVSVLA
jgi:hypothetical protein